MSEVEASSMAEPVSTKKKKHFELNEPARTVTTIHNSQTREVEPQFARFTEFFIYASF